MKKLIMVIGMAVACLMLAAGCGRKEETITQEVQELQEVQKVQICNGFFENTDIQYSCIYEIQDDDKYPNSQIGIYNIRVGEEGKKGYEYRGVFNTWRNMDKEELEKSLIDWFYTEYEDMIKNDLNL